MHKFVSIAVFSSVLATAWYGYYNFENQIALQQNKQALAIKGKAVSKAPDFTAFTNVDEKKHAFFAYLKPGIALENQRVVKERERLRRIQSHFKQDQITSTDTQDAEHLAHLYQTELTDGAVTEQWIDNMLHLVDVLPDALVLTQAANESAWGTSRFARKAKNYFGQWCYSEGCGLVPLQRGEGMSHEVAKFSSVQESINRYFMNVNRNSAYSELREIRFELREDGADLLTTQSAMEMSNGLLKYSERGEDNIEDLQAMMRHNEKYWIN